MRAYGALLVLCAGGRVNGHAAAVCLRPARPAGNVAGYMQSAPAGVSERARCCGVLTPCSSGRQCCGLHAVGSGRRVAEPETRHVRAARTQEGTIDEQPPHAR
jgi:hypothetical protein